MLFRSRLIPLIRYVSTELLATPSSTVSDILVRCSEEPGMQLPFTDTRNVTWFCFYIIHHASAIKRRNLVTALVQQGIRVFGDAQGWQELVGPALPVSPAVDYNTALGALYRSISVNVNITSCQMKTAVNQRVFDIPAAGGFVISDDQQDLSRLFTPEEETVTYQSPEELREKAAFYAGHQSARMKIVASAAVRIRAEYTYRHRIREISRTLFSG